MEVLAPGSSVSHGPRPRHAATRTAYPGAACRASPPPAILLPRGRTSC